jgi:hypothetical protein
MKNKMTHRISIAAALTIVCLLTGSFAFAQAASRLVGTITAIGSNTLTVKTDADGEHQVVVPASAALKRIAPGQKDLSTAEAIQFSDLAIGDRALVKLDPDAPAGTFEALQIIAIKQADVALKQQKDREDWQRRSVGGLVKGVDVGTGTVLVSSGAGAMAKTVTVHTTKTTILKRYAPTSVRFDAALPAPIDAIHVGDQLRARGTKDADGSEIAADEVVSGSFRNIAGTITSIDPGASTIVAKDLATKKAVTIHVTADAQMRRLPERMATMLAARLKGTAGNGAGAPGGGSPWAGQNGGQGGAGGDPQQMLNRLPAIPLSDLQKGEAVMLVSTQGESEVTAISLLAGVEPLLEAPEASRNLLANWSMNTSAPDAAQ